MLSLLCTTTELRAAYATGEATPQDALDAVLEQVAAVDPAIRAIAALDVDGARQAARESGERWAAGHPRSVLDGVPVTVKESIAAAGMPLRHGVAANAALPNSTVDAPPTARLREAGAVIVGTTTMPDMGMMASGTSSMWGITRNPWDLSCSPGGSSAGAGAALAAGIGWGAVGSDIAGSVRLPAGQCGLVALKPTQGRIPHLPSSTVRSAGPMARTVREAAELFTVLAGPDPRDELSLAPDPMISSALDADLLPAIDLRELRVGVLTDLGYGRRADAEVLAVVRRAADALAAGGASVEAVEPPFDADPYPALDRVFAVRARTEYEGLEEGKRAEVRPELVAWSAQADAISATDLQRDLAQVGAARDQIAIRLAPFDVVLAPVLPVVSFPAERVGLDPTQPLGHCLYTCWFNQTGQPAAAFCGGTVRGMPVGVQVVGPRFADRRVLAVTAALEAARAEALAWPLHPTPAAKTV